MSEGSTEEKGAGELTPKRSRRQLIAGAVGALGVLAVEAAARVPAAQATQGQAVIAGQGNTATSTTGITNTNQGAGLSVVGASDYAGVVSTGLDQGYGVVGYGGRSDGIGVFGQGFGAGAGVFGANTDVGGGPGVHGSSASTAGGATAILGQLTSTSPGAYSSAVRGQNSGTGAFGIGVYGSQEGSGWGVYGTTPNGIGVNGISDSGPGVQGSAGALGVGVLAQNTAGGQALQVSGPSVFSRSGLVSIVSPNKSATVAGVPLTPSSLVLATVQNSVGRWVASAVPNVPASSFTINLNKAPAVGKTATVAWFVVN